MEKPQWLTKQQQSVTMNLERPDNFLNNGSGNNLLENADRNGNCDEEKCRNPDKSDKNLRIEQVVEATVSEKSKKTVENILELIKTLAPGELLFLYLKLPTECSNAVDPLRQPLNPLGSRSEISQTIMWIKTHLEEDPELSLPKQDVYNEYFAFCGPNKIKPLSTADFGKVMKQVYPRVRPRRLGTRGNSRYCYAGLRRRLKLEPPILPDLSDKPMSTEMSCSPSDLLSAAWTIVKEWSEQQLGTHFSSLQSLACHLALHLSIGNGSSAATLVTSTNKNLKDELISGAVICNNKHRETTLQLQRKIQQRHEINREQKRKQPQSPKVEQKASRSKKCKLQQAPASSATNTSTPSGDATTSPSQGLQTVCDKSIDFTNVQTLPDFSSFQKAAPAPAAVPDKGENGAYKQNGSVMPTEGGGGADAPKPNAAGKLPIPRLSATAAYSKSSPSASPKRVKNAKYKIIQPKPEPCDIAAYKPQFAAEHRSQKAVRARKLDPPPSDCSQIPLSRERLISISNMDKDALDDYLGTNNSQEHEEELMKYFENGGGDNAEHDTYKLSQLRQLLERNGVNNNNDVEAERVKLTKVLSLSSLLESKSAPKSVAYPAQSLQQFGGGLNARRRVSFEVPHQEDAVPPSPNTRRKNFSFTPISPGPLSPNGRLSKCSSATASPFVSPRNTPVPRAKSNSTHQASSFVASQLPPGRKCRNFKIKIETEPALETTHVEQAETGKEAYLPMSAPPSPKLPKTKTSSNLLQKLLNSDNKVPYTPDYPRTQCFSASLQDPLAKEISQFFSNGNHELTVDTSYRSQSVPIHMALKSNLDLTSPVIQTGCLTTQFPFCASAPGADAQNDFSDFDTFAGADNINMNKILNTLDECHTENLLQNASLPGADVFPTINDIDMNLTETNLAFEQQGAPDVLPAFIPNLRGLGRSQSIDIDTTIALSNSLKYNPSRSVPGTPVPYSLTKVDVSAKSYRSYPSTPLTATETFTYNQSQDYLLNGQPIKDKMHLDSYLKSGEGADEIYRNNVEIFQVADVLNNEVLMDNKGEFNFEGQLAEGNFGAKHALLEDGCVVIQGDYDFKTGPDAGT